MIIYGGLQYFGLFNTDIGLSNIEKNTEAAERAKRIEQKLDKLLEMLNNE